MLIKAALLLVLIVSAPAAGWAMIDNMVAQGTGIAKYLGFIPVYRATLLTGGEMKEDEFLAESASRCLRLQYEVSVKAEDFVLAAATVLARQHSAATLARLKNDIERLHRGYTDVKPGDVYEMCYSADDQTTRLWLNGREQAAISSAEFASVYFGIWLGPVKPLDERLRDNLLGIR